VTRRLILHTRRPLQPRASLRCNLKRRPLSRLKQKYLSGIPPPGGSWLTPYDWSGSSGPTLGEKTEAEHIADAAFARPGISLLSSQPPSIDIDEQSNVAKLASSAPTTGLGLEKNPIMKDMQENRTSWINFLSLRVVHRYRVVTESGEPVAQDVGEVMGVTADPTFPPPEEFSIEETVKAQKGSRWVGQRKQPKGPLDLPLSSPGKKGSESPTPNPVPPLTDSDSIKAKTELTPGKDKENRARPPNMYIAASPSTSSKRQCYAQDTKKVGELVIGVLLGKVESKSDKAEGGTGEEE